jgi:site-specific DNA-adenine methylase
VNSAIKHHEPKSKAVNTVCYFDPPYDDDTTAYDSKYEEAIAQMNWAITFIIDRCTKLKMRTPYVLVSNSCLYNHRKLKYRVDIKIKSKHNIKHKARMERLLSNKGSMIGREKVIVI